MKQTISLDGAWQIAGFDEGRGDWALADSATPGDAITLEGHVPGEVHVDLLRAGLIPDPYYGKNACEVQWVEAKEWWYKKTFDISEDFLRNRTCLEFDGLDTYATVFLNGSQVGKSENMFIPQKFEVTELLREGANTVAIRFDPAAKVVGRLDCAGLFGCFDTPRVHARKMQCAFGWDWTHRFVGAGVWRGARIVAHDVLSITDVRVETEVEGAYANAWITIEVENSTREDQVALASVVVALGDAREKIEVVETVSPFGGIIEAVVRIEEPQLWWPNGFGKQTLYTCMVGLQFEGEVQDVSQSRFGVRDVRFVEQDDEGNPAFTLLVNGENVFCKGANWIPADHFVSNVTPERCRELISLAADAHFNMLRVWGGGIYEQPAFYEACDELGIMVWQDFMFSCAHYSDTDEFRAQVAREVSTAVRQLRGYPSIVVWCGNNECEMNAAPDAQWPGKRLFHEVIPDALNALDRTRPYRPSSPYGGETGNAPSVGDRHGGAWFKTYLGDHHRWRHIVEQDSGLFLSEFPVQGPPEVESIREFIPEDKLFPPTNDVWEFHNKDNPHSSRTDGLTHQQILVDLTQRMMGGFDSVEQFAAYAGILQGEFLRAEIEHFRREKWAISGAMFWMYNDCWPAVDWSIVDYYLRPKAAYYYVRRAFAPVIASFKQFEDRVQLYLTSDHRTRDLAASLRIGIYTFSTCGFEPFEAPVRVVANTSAAVWESEPVESILADPARQAVVALLDVDGRVISKSFHFPLTFAEMQFPQPKLLVNREQVDEDSHRLIISADDFARNVAVGNLPAAARLSDNYFDLLPGEMHDVTIDNVTEEQAKALTINVWRR